ncbi:fungal-specific transcription factor domain-containing protein [Fusarium flagelliforme]|uniref:fungal-specific transcription factor domain-containing protein n=1 Tax=Fusarium flagelliforme TaxID=2675880 RepID=UPI001E8CF4B5|nr:fungal-specific transcription factor domain-containing protein [Fusarium flagelliforme]KAH7193987.1 fungal-specific transcription factor domain-containing protein [Fusarium flagelliforme]
MSSPQRDSPHRLSLSRKAQACNECKRRKVRCSGGAKCTNCTRDKKECRYSSVLESLTTLQRRLNQAEKLISSMEKAWAVHLPEISIQDAIRRIESAGQNPPPSSSPGTLSEAPETRYGPASNQPPNDPSPAEWSNAEDYEFDETQDFDNTTDGMGSLITEPGKVGYTGPQSGVAALKFLQTLHLYIPADQPTLFPLDDPDSRSTSEASAADISRYIDDYFKIYHSSYPILHEGTFRARLSGALAKPRDGSWPLLHNIVIAIGAFVGATDASDSDVPFYKKARQSLTMEILEKGSLSYVQGLVLMANYLQKRNKPNSGFVLIGIGWSMALAIGLHREFFLPSSSPFTMEIRRRAWWAIFVFVSGAQLTLGRPPASLVGVNVRPPSNLDDQDLAVDMESLPSPKDGPSTTSCLAQHARLAQIANMVQVELLAHQIPSHDRAVTLDRSIAQWHKDLPSYFDENLAFELWFEIPKRILIWRSFHLRIVLSRPILFRRIKDKESLDISIEPISTCLSVAEKCVESICGYIEREPKQPRGLAWYATYWLITATFVQATCCIYEPAHPLAPAWKRDLSRAVECLWNLGSTNSMALRARDILKRLLDQREIFLSLFETPTSSSASQNLQSTSMDIWELTTQSNAPPAPDTGGQDRNAMFFGERGMPFPFYAQTSSDAELLDATGGIMLQGSSDSTGPDSGWGTWMPGW